MNSSKVSTETKGVILDPNPRFIRSKELKRVYGITVRTLARMKGAPKGIKKSHRVVLFSIADLDFYFRRNQGGSVRGTSLAKKISDYKRPLNGSSVIACSYDTQEKEEKAS